MRRWTLGVGLVIAALGCGSEQGGGADSGGGRDTGGTGGAFDPLYSGYFQKCRACHTPGAWGSYVGIERTLDFSTVETAYTSLTTGTASGLDGNDAACNGVRLVGSSYETSLVAAVLDEDVRAAFFDAAHPGCDADSIPDMTVKVGEDPSGAFLQALRGWIDAGTPR